MLWLWLPPQHLRSQASLDSAEKTCGGIYSQNLHPHKGGRGKGWEGGGGQTFDNVINGDCLLETVVVVVATG